MRIAAINIPAGWFPHIFGDDHADVTINLGGRNLYSIKDNHISEVRDNPFFLDDIFDRSISLFSCVVGGNGGGKSTLLRMIIANDSCTYVIEDEEGRPTEVDSLSAIHRIYYTPYLHENFLGAVGANGKDLSKLAIIKTDNHGDGALLDDFLLAHHSENSKRWIRFNHFFRKLQLPKIKIPVFHRVKLVINNFDVNKHGQEKFHNTPFQLRSPIKVLFDKIEEEQRDKEIILSERMDLSQKRSEAAVFMIKFEYALYESAIGKLVNILERTGNRYLQEGYVPDDYRLQFGARNVRDSIDWFLRNTGVTIGNYSFSNHLQLLDLIDYVRSLINTESVTSNWLQIMIGETQALRVIELYDAFNNSFAIDQFRYDSTPLFGFEPQIIVSSGEQQFLNLFSILYDHAENIRVGIDVGIYPYDSSAPIGNDILLLLDEGDNAFHPQWKKEYVKNLRTILPLIFPNYKIQVIITSHDPLTLSDLPKNNVVFLERGSEGTVIGNSALKRTFGANIADLLKDSFFLEDGMIGSFSADVINKIISDIEVDHYSNNRRREIERIIEAIDEPIIKFKLAEKFGAATGNTAMQRKIIDDEITRLQARRSQI